LARRIFKVNLIPYNPTGHFHGSPCAAMSAFRTTLVSHDIPTTVRLTRGRDTEAAYGQLAVSR
jgi:23S rRNA (adenine2503-C2)-methyltransferase